MQVSRGSRLSDVAKLGWRLASLLLAFSSCKGGSGEDGSRIPGPGMETRFSILASPQRAVDILFMVDNSPSMDPKQAALAEAFPSMIQKLQTLGSQSSSRRQSAESQVHPAKGLPRHRACQRRGRLLSGSQPRYE